MRLLQLRVPQEQVAAVREVLRAHQLGYTETATAGEHQDTVLVNVLLPADAVEHVMNDLQDEGYTKESYTVSIDAEFAHFEEVDAVQNRWEKTPNRLAPDALRSKAKDLRRNSRSYLWMMVLSAIVATAGLLLGSPAIVVGSMVIAPIVSPVLTASVGAVRNDGSMFIDSIHMQAYGLAVAILTATGMAWLVREFQVVPVVLSIEQLELISLRVSPSLLAIAVGVAAGAAGAYGLATKGEVTIVGVMIAAALIPTAAAVGIGIAWGNVVLAIGALLLLVVTMIAINVAGSAMLWYLEYRPDDVDESLLHPSGLRQIAVVAMTLLFVLTTVALAGGLFVHQSSFERSTNTAIDDVLVDDEYDELAVVATTIEFNQPMMDDEPEITVEVARTDGQAYPNLADEFERAIAERTGEPVRVSVRFLDYLEA